MRGTRLGVALAALAAAVALGGPVDDVYRVSAHGSPSTGVARVATSPRGHCQQCHVRQAAPWSQPAALFTTDDNALCLTCHASANASGTYAGPAAFTTSAHWGSGRMLWPGPAPAARPVGDEGLCVNCHAVHGARDGLGLVPDLTQVREESLCLACHDASGPSVKNLLVEIQRPVAHAPQATVDVHRPGEAAPAAFASGPRRHAECVDCHNPHLASGPDGGSALRLAGVSRVRFDWTAATASPTWIPNGDPSPAREHEVCFKCHSSFTTLPPGARDKAAQVDPRAASFHPIAASGTNATAAMAQSLAGGTGLPHLTVTSLVECQDCHASSALPLTVSSLSSYVGAIARGPHGSAIAPDAGYSGLAGALLRARYRTSGSAASLTADFALCFICHASAPFTGNGSAATNFGAHRKHVGDKGHLCKECHEDLHGTRLSAQVANHSYARLVSFPLTVTGSSGSGVPTWTPKTSTSQGSCSLRCHGKAHDAERY